MRKWLVSAFAHSHSGSMSQWQNYVDWLCLSLLYYLLSALFHHLMRCTLHLVCYRAIDGPRSVYFTYIADWRKPVIVTSAILTGAASVAFGFSTTFAMAIILRFFVGFLNGTPHNLHFCLQHFIALFHSREWWCSQSVVVRIVWQHQSGFWDGSAHISIWYRTSTRTSTVRSYSRSCWTVQPHHNQ